MVLCVQEVSIWDTQVVFMFAKPSMIGGKTGPAYCSILESATDCISVSLRWDWVSIFIGSARFAV